MKVALVPNSRLDPIQCDQKRFNRCNIRLGSRLSVAAAPCMKPFSGCDFIHPLKQRFMTEENVYDNGYCEETTTTMSRKETEKIGHGYGNINSNKSENNEKKKRMRTEGGRKKNMKLIYIFKETCNLKGRLFNT